MRILLGLIALIVPRAERPRWREEWLAEVQHGGWRMLTGALPDAWTMRKVLPAEAGRHPKPFHALDQDIRYALRSFSADRSFTLAVVGSLAIGIAATTAAFAVVNAALFRPYPGVQAQEQLVRITLGPRNTTVWDLASWDDIEAIRNGVPAVENLTVAHGTAFAAAPGGETPRTVGGLIVSANYFDVLGVKPTIGRFFMRDDDTEGRPAVVVSYAYWQQHLGGDASVLERNVFVNGRALPVIGVAPEGFGWVFTRADADLWIPFSQSDLVFRDDFDRPADARSAGPFDNTIIGRLRPAATIEQASAQAAGLTPAIAARRPRNSRDLTVRVQPLRVADPAQYAPFAAALLAVPLIVLAIACVNAANLLLARASRRSLDWLVRLALGASRWRLIRLLLVESGLLALAGAALGLLICSWIVSLVQSWIGYTSITIDINVVLFVVGVALATALVFGLGPALTVTRAAVNRAAEAGRFMRGPFGSRTRAALVTLQAALCLGLLATGAQFTNTLRTLTDEGLPEPKQFLRASLDLDKLRYDRAQSEAFYAQLLQRATEIPAVKAAGLANTDVLSGSVGSSSIRVWVPGWGPDPRRGVVTMYAAGRYFEAMGIPILQGRGFTADEQRGTPRVAIVNQPFADEIFGGAALGHALRIGVQDAKETTTHDVMIVGVVPSPARRRTDSLPMVYYPVPLQPEPRLDLLVRVDGDPSGVGAAIRTIATGIDSRVPVERIVTGEELRRLRNSIEYNLAQTLSALGLLALVLAASGLYGVVSYMVTQRQKEIGIRMALGAGGASVLRLVLRQSLVPVMAGCVLGAIGAVTVAALIRSRLYGVSPMDPVAFGGATLLLLAVMMVASLAPARRASRVDPVEVLRQE
jgi:predicted permease